MCYSDCSKTKQACDDSFHDCMKDQCSTIHDKDTCLFYTDVFSLAVQLGGCEAYKDSIGMACDCV